MSRDLKGPSCSSNMSLSVSQRFVCRLGKLRQKYSPLHSQLKLSLARAEHPIMHEPLYIDGTLHDSAYIH